ncbi:MAG: AAA family ATPase [Erysipelotrichaceae bacterium]|nr:AAA family ATPase [Erysipelotrichaceae bacterium]
MTKQITRIVVTGGPCAGKSTLMSRAVEIFSERGYRVLIIHETATELITGGITPLPDNIGMYGFQKYVNKMMIEKEEIYNRAAEELKDENILILLDRALLDNKGYVSEKEWEEITSGMGLNDEEIVRRYDMVLHLVTAANGAEEAYTLQNNAARYETVDDAIRVDNMIQKSWSIHPNRVIIGNETDFEEKVRRAVQAIFSFLGKEKPVEKFKKYLVEVNPEVIGKLEQIGAQKDRIFQHFLKSTPGWERRIRTREKDGSVVCYYSEAYMVTPFTRVKRDRIISNGEYIDMTREIDTTLHPIDKTRYSFPYNDEYFKLDVFSFDQTQGLLSVQMTDENMEVDVPEFFTVIKEVSDILNYKNYHLAKSQKF